MYNNSVQFSLFFFHIINAIPDAERWIQFSDEISHTWIMWETLKNAHHGREKIRALFPNLTETIIYPYKWYQNIRVFFLATCQAAAHKTVTYDSHLQQCCWRNIRYFPFTDHHQPKHFSFLIMHLIKMEVIRRKHQRTCSDHTWEHSPRGM